MEIAWAESAARLVAPPPTQPRRLGSGEHPDLPHTQLVNVPLNMAWTAVHAPGSPPRVPQRPPGGRTFSTAVAWEPPLSRIV